MEGNSNTLSKKTIIAIIIAIILLFVASLSVGIFLANKGDTEAAGGNQISDGNQISVGNRIEDNNQNTNTENNNSETPSDNINNSTVADNSNETTNNNNTVNDTSDNVENNTTNRTNNSTSGVTTKRDTSQVGETTVTRVEEKERVVSRDYWDWWTPTSVAVVSTATKLVPTLPEIVVEKVATTEAGKNVVYAGQKITYTITVKNTGNKDVEKIEVTDKIPENTTFSSIENDGKVIKKENGEKILGVKWIVDVKAGEQVSVKFTVTVNEKMLVETENGEIAEIPTTGTIRNVAVANGEESNEEDTAIITSKKASEIIRDGQKVEIAKLGDEIKYTITVTNTGERDGNTTISDVVPIGTRLKHDSADGAKISENNDIVTWEDVKIPAGESISKTFIVIVNDLDALKENKVRNVATVGGKETNETEDPVAIDILVTKEWNDADNQDGIRPDKITVKLLANDVVVDTVEISKDENGNWSHVFENLPKFLDEQEINYSVKEDDVEGYTPEISGDIEKGFLVTNTHEPAEIEIPVEKTWDDAENQDGIRPDSVIIKLLADGKDTGKILTLNEDNEWKGTFKELDKNKAGREIAYTIKEEPVPSGYEVAITGTAATGFLVTNTHEPAEIEIPVEKTWNDAENQDGKRTDSVTIKLLADGEDTGKILTLNEDNEWKGKFTELDKNKAGKEIAYTIKEEPVPSGYEVAITGTAATRFLVTNTHTPAKVTIQGTKTWDDSNNSKGKRPSSITIKLLADGVKTGEEVTITKEDSWQYKFENMPKYKSGESGKEIKYTVEEEYVTDYEPTYDDHVEANGNITINIKNTFSQDISGKIISIKETPVPLDVVFVLDISSSMLQTDNDNTTRVQDMVEATNVAISKLMENKNNRVSVVLYNSYVYDLSGNLNYYSRKNNDYITYKHIGGTEIGGKVKFCTGKTIEVSTAAREGGKYCGTYTQGGIKRATQIFKASADNSIVRKPVMILLTDGDPTHYDTKTTYNKYGDRYPGTNRLNGIGIVRFVTSEYYAYTMKTMENCKKSITGFYKDSNRKENRECEVYTVGINMKGSMANVLIKPNETNINSLRNTTNISPDVYNGNKDANGNSVWVVGLSNLCNGERLMNEKYYKYQANGLLELLKQNDKTKISGNYANEAYTELTSSKISEKFMEIVNIIEEKTTIDITADLYGSDRKIKLNEFNPNNEYTISITKNGVAIANPEQYIIKDPKDGYYYLTLTNLKGKLHVEMTYYK